MTFRKKKSRFSLLGLSFEDIVRYFFAGNASFAILAIALICFFLLREALNFFPDHMRELEIYRKSGLEYYDLIENEFNSYKKSSALLQRAFQAELNCNIEEINAKLFATRTLKQEINQSINKLLTLREEAFQNAQSASEKRQLFTEIAAKFEQKIIAKRETFIRNVRRTDTPEFRKVDSEFFEKIRSEFLQADALAKKDPSILVELEATRDKLLETEFEKAKYLNAEFLVLRRAGRELNRYWSKVRKDVLQTRDLAVESKKSSRLVTGAVKHILHDLKNKEKLRVGLQEISANKYIAPKAKELLRLFVLQKTGELRDGEDIFKEEVEQDTALRKLRKLRTFLVSYEVDEQNASRFQKIAKFSTRLEQKLRAFIISHDYSQNAEKLRASLGKHDEANKKLVNTLQETRKKLSLASPKSERAQEILAKFDHEAKRTIKLLEKTQGETYSWRYDKALAWPRVVFSFFLGKKWVTNSSIQDKYGLLPLFTGSLIISLIAISISVPISIAAAVYVNQIAGTREQDILKPAIEFIGAIPSVVLGFIGIVVLGGFLQELSMSPWLSFLPGFPINERLNMLNAGLLLAFMATPTIFSLAEDALNNSPSAYRDGSLALGASKIQTAIKVVLPSAISGVLAACLLGFGRIIGETMVVLLVAGNRISMPNFAEGLGVMTQPSHTMTGIIAQELGEVAHGSMHYRALFMVGFTLFMISMLINYLAQKMIKHYGIGGR